MVFELRGVIDDVSRYAASKLLFYFIAAGECDPYGIVDFHDPTGKHRTQKDDR
jgi:hypothetical protein